MKRHRTRLASSEPADLYERLTQRLENVADREGYSSHKENLKILYQYIFPEDAALEKPVEIKVPEDAPPILNPARYDLIRPNPT